MNLDEITEALCKFGLDDNLAYNIACLADSLRAAIEDDPDLDMDHTKWSEFVYTTIKGKKHGLSLGPTYPYTEK
jgi:hypothetical protein